MATQTYRAIQVSQPGKLELVERELTPPPAGTVQNSRECVRHLPFGFAHRRRAPSGPHLSARART